MDEPNICLYCNNIIDSDDFLTCTVCAENVHVKCLRRPGTPGDLLGDVFFDFVCVNCSGTHKEEFTRIRLPWLMIIALTIYNLSIQSNGLGRHGFFHWRSHIAYFIEKNWNFLFPAGTKRRKKWTGTISGTLSHNSPDFFISGQDVFQDSGWWKLTYNQTPKFYSKLYEQLSHKRQLLRNDKKHQQEESCYSSDISNSTTDEVKRKRPDGEEEFSRTLPYMGRPPKKLKKPEVEDESKELNMVQSSLMDFIASSLTSDDLLLNDDIPDISTDGFLPLIPTPNVHFEELNNWNDDFSQLSYELENDHMPQNDMVTSMIESLTETASPPMEEEEFKPRIIQITNFQNASPNSQSIKTEASDLKQEVESLSENEGDPELVCEKSLFTISTKRELPWKKEELNDDENVEDETCESMGTMSEYEEKELHKQLKNILSAEQESSIKVPSWIRRFYRKLCIRIHKRANLKPLFDLDSFGTIKAESSTKARILDRYNHVRIISNTPLRDDCSFHARISGSTHYDVFESPHTSRILHPFIYRNTKCLPTWMKLMCELQHSVNGEIPSRASVDFCYVRPHHIAAVNALLQLLFWPGIDMSECLSYPEFSVVALYKKLIVGCAFLVPDATYNEAYISFMAVRPGWQRCGIATFMLYHLAQTCMGKDITLHVSASNPAICLYQKFGFKIEEVILDFYDKYMPVDSTQSRHAFFLRLTR